MRTVTDDAITVLETGGLTVGDATGKGLTAPYVVAFPIGDIRDGTIGQPWVDLRASIQFTCVGVSREQAEWLQDRVVTLMTAASATFGHVEVLPSGAIARDDDISPPLFYAYPRFVLHTA